MTNKKPIDVSVIGEVLAKRTIKERLKEKLGLRTTSTLIVPSLRYKDKVFPSFSFDKLNDIQTGDPDTGAAMDMIAGQVVRGGFETTMNEDYAEKSDGLTAKEVVDEKCQEFNIDQIAKEMTSDIIGYGESFIWKGKGKIIRQAVRIMPSTIKLFNFDDMGLELQGIETYATDFSADELIRGSYNRIGKQPLGFGILQALATGLVINGVSREPLIVMKSKIMQAMVNQIQAFSSPKQIWILPDCPDDKLPAYRDQIKKMQDGEVMLTNKSGASVVNAVAERMRGLDLYVEKIWNSYYIALQTPIPQLFSGDQLTQASASSALTIAEVGKIDDLRRYIKRLIEREFFIPWLDDAGLDPKQAKVRLNWRLMQRPDANVLLPIIQKGRENNDLTRTEYRRIIADFGLPIDPQATKELEEEDKKREAMNQQGMPQQDGKSPNSTNPDQPIQSAKKKYEVRRDDQNYAGE